MRIFPIASNRANAAKTHFQFLNQQCNALMQFKHQFHPGFKIFNDSPLYYTYEELFDRGVLKLAKLPNTEGSLPDALIVVTPKLEYGEGVINNFPYLNVYVFYGDEENLSKPPYSIVNGVVQIPANALFNRDDKKTKADLYIQPENTTPQLILTHDEKEKNGTLWITHNQNTYEIKEQNLLIKKFLPNRATIHFTDIHTDAELADGTLQELEPSAYIVSVYSNEKGWDNKTSLDIEEARKKSNFLVARFARGGGYYQFLYTTVDGSIGALLQYIPEATDSMGLEYVIDGDPRQKRFIATSSYDLFLGGISSAETLSFVVDDSNKTLPQITTIHGGLWSGNNLINHDFYFNNGGSRESFIVDDCREKGVTKLKKVSTPSYMVNFQNNYGFTPIFILW